MKISFPWAFLLGSVLVILKALGNIDLAWIWVLAPFWVPLAIVFAPVLFVIASAVFLGVVYVVVMPIAYAVDYVDNLRRKRRSHASQKFSRYNR